MRFLLHPLPELRLEDVVEVHPDAGHLAGVDLELVQMRYLDSIGMAASIANRFLLKASSPTPAQIELWDQRLVPLSKLCDPLLRYRLGKSLLAIWRRI